MSIHLLERALLGTCNLCFALLPRPRPSRAALADCKIVSHRGEHDNRGVYENTLEAFDAAAAAGCWGLEFDLRWTRDLQPVVIHDPGLRRVFGIDIDVAAVDLAELRRRAPLVPTLAEVVERYGARQHLMMELKRDDLEQLPRRVERLREILAPLQARRDYHVLVLDTDLLELAGFCDQRAWLPVAQFNLRQLSREALRRELAGVCGQYLLLRRERILRHHRQGQKVGSGFAASRFGLYREVNRGVDWVFTNHAVKLETLRRRLLEDN